jgi:2-haloacid dehalogenase
LVRNFPDHKLAIEAWYGRWRETIDGAIPGTVEILEALRQSKKYRLYALTNWSAETFPWALDNFEFLHWFEGIVVSGQEKTRKPFPDFFQILFDRHQVDPKKSVFIDDNHANIIGGNEVGLNTIHFKSPEQLRNELKHLNIVV